MMVIHTWTQSSTSSKNSNSCICSHWRQSGVHCAPQLCRKQMLCALWPISDHDYMPSCVLAILICCICAFSQLQFVALVTVILLLTSVIVPIILFNITPLQHWLPCIRSLSSQMLERKGQNSWYFEVSVGYIVIVTEDACEYDKHVHTEEKLKIYDATILKKEHWCIWTANLWCKRQTLYNCATLSHLNQPLMKGITYSMGMSLLFCTMLLC